MRLTFRLAPGCFAPSASHPENPLLTCYSQERVPLGVEGEYQVVKPIFRNSELVGMLVQKSPVDLL